MNDICLKTICVQKKRKSIGLIDSGVNFNHCDLDESTTSFLHIDDQGQRSSKTSHDTSYHGTFNASLLCGKSNDVKIKAITPNSKLYVCGAIEGLNLAKNILEALEWMLEQPIHILLMPFGMKGTSPLFSSFLQRFVDKGILPIAAIGNEGAGKFRAPGFYSNVLSVGASNNEGIIAPFSGSYNSENTECIKPDIVTDGVDIESPFKKIGLQSGTSMAATILAGHAARLWQAKPSATNHDIYNAIMFTATPNKKGQEHRCKHGIFNFEKAEQYIKTGTTINKHQLVEQSFTKYVDPYLIQESKYVPISKLFEFIIILKANTSNKYLEGAFPKLEILKKYNNNNIIIVSGNKEIIEQLVDDVRIKLIQSTEVPFFSFD